MKNKILIVVLLFALGAGGYLYKDFILDLFGFNNGSDVAQEPSQEQVVTAESNSDANTNDTQSTSNIDTSSSQKATEASCLKNNFDDCVTLAKQYLDSNEVKALESITLLGAPCENKHAASCALLASIYNNGAGVVGKSDFLYLGYLSKACELGDIESCYSLGVDYYRGMKNILPANHLKAFDLFKKVCDSGDIKGCNNLAVIYNNGSKGVAKNIKLANKIFSEACSKGYKPSCDNLSKLK